MRDDPQRGPFHQDGNLVVGSKEVEAHYPELDVEVAAEEAKLEIEASDLEIEVDEVELALFLACSMTQKQVNAEGLKDMVHRRRHKAGARPGLTCQAVTGGTARRLEDQAWLLQQELPTEQRR